MAQGKRGERIVVVGAGVFGSWTAHHLQNAGHHVTLIDAWGASHSRASSGGESRLTRAGYGKDAVYTRMASDSLPQWQALSAVSGLPILIPNGVVFFSAVEDDYFRGSIDVHRQLGLPIERMDRATMQRRFPMIDFDRHRSRAVRGQVRRADGAPIRADARRSLRPRGRRISAWCCGARSKQAVRSLKA